jgi:hypothetical protein
MPQTHRDDVAGDPLGGKHPPLVQVSAEIFNAVADEGGAALLLLHLVPGEGDAGASHVDELRLAWRSRKSTRVGRPMESTCGTFFDLIKYAEG